jgi:SAM-dependent methyltransferase
VGSISGHVPLYGVYRNLVEDNTCIDWGGSLHKNPYLDFEADLTAPLPFDDKSFDTVLLTDVLEHLPEPASTLNEIARVLRPDGKLLLGVPFLYWIHEEPHDYHRYTEFALRRMCERSGLKIVDLQAYGGLPEVLCDLLGKGLNFFPAPLPVLLRPLLWTALLLNKTWPSRKIAKWSQDSVPLGYVLVAQK